MDPISLIGILIPAAVALIGSIIDYNATQSTNETNQNINSQNIDYNSHVTQEQWERDDTAHQREVADLQAAGLSPLANTTGSQVTSGLAAPNPIAMQAPQLNLNSLVNSLLRSEELSETKRHNKEIEGHTETELNLKGEEIKNQVEQLRIENKRVEDLAKYQADLIKNELDTIAETKEHNDEEEYLRRVEYESEQYWKEIKAQVPGDYSYYDVYDFDIYQNNLKLWNIQFSNFIRELGATQSASAQSSSSNTSVGGSIGATVPGSPVGANIGANGSQGSNESSYSMENISKKQEQMIAEFYSKHPKPVYHMKRWERKK